MNLDPAISSLASEFGMMESIKTAMDGTIGTQTMTEWMTEP